MEFAKFKLTLQEKVNQSDNLKNPQIEKILQNADRVRKVQEPCPECESDKVYCTYGETGGSLEYIDNFSHVCLDCLYVIQDEDKTQTGQETSKDMTCPYCKESWLPTKCP